MIISKKKKSSKHQYKAEFKMTAVLSSDFSGLRTFTASLTSLASATSMAFTASKALFHLTGRPGARNL
jgi:hypothetical protein